MMNKRTVLIGVAIVILISGLIVLTAAQNGSSAQDDPTAQAQTVEAVVQQRFTQTAEAAQQIALTEAAQTQAAATEPPSPPTQTAEFQATVDAAFAQALQATAQAEMAAAVTARGVEIISPSNARRLKASSDFGVSTSDLTQVAFSADGKLFATGNQEGAVQLWDPVSGAELRSIAGHDTGITSLAFSPDSAFLVSVSQDGILHVWDTVSGEAVISLQGDALTCAAFGPDGKTLITGGENGAIKTWDAASGEPIQEFTSGIGTIRNVVVNPGNGQIAISGDVGTVQIWDVTSGTLLHDLPYASNITGVAFSPDGQWLAATSKDSAPWQWDASTGAQLWAEQAVDQDDVAYSPDGKLIATVSGSKKQVIVWEAATGKRLHAVRAGNDPVSVAFSPDGAGIAAGGKNVRLWDVPVPVVKPTAVVSQPTPGPALPTLTPKPGATPRPAIFPTDTLAQVQIAEQVFEHGRMFWIAHNREIWVMEDNPSAMPNGGDWFCYYDTFEDGEPETDPSLIPPDDLIQPKRGFGKVWRTVPGIRDAIGWAITPEFDLMSYYTYIAGGYVQNGQYYPGPGEHRLTTLYGQSISFFEREIRGDCVGGTWQYTADQ
jgi:dipeptidyl aminopeptidase/acylaminoacyl peptidase